MQQTRVTTDLDRIAHARIGLVAHPAAELIAIEEQLRQAGAVVRRSSPSDPLWWRQTGQDAVIVHVDSDVSGDLDWLSLLASHQRVVALFDAFPEAGVPDVADFVVAPFRAPDVLARLGRVLQQPVHEDQLEAGNLRLDIATRIVRIDERAIDLTFKEFELLRALLAVDEIVLSREELKHHLGSEATANNRVMDLLVHRLRGKLTGWVGGRIETVRNVGYHLTRR